MTAAPRIHARRALRRAGLQRELLLLDRWRERRRLKEAAARHRPARPLGRVVITGLTPLGFGGRGKVSPRAFFPVFAEELAGAGIETRFVLSEAALHRALTGVSACVIHVFNEESDCAFRAETAACESIRLEGPVFNDYAGHRRLASKAETARVFAGAGIPVPARASELGAGRAVFSICDEGSQVDGELVAGGEVPDPGRHNRAFVDTRVTVGGAEYYTTIRMLCVGGALVHAFVRARPVSEGNPTVHTADTPRDAALIEHLHAALVVPNLPRLEALARRIAEVLGPGFYAHDLLVCRESGEILVCESGVKFDGPAYADHLRPVAERLPSQAILFGDGLARASARAFLGEARRLGWP